MTNDEKRKSSTKDNMLLRMNSVLDASYTNSAPDNTGMDVLKRQADEMANTIIELYGEKALELARIYERDLSNVFAEMVTKNVIAKLRGE
jgi:hypothetical protein